MAGGNAAQRRTARRLDALTLVEAEEFCCYDDARERARALLLRVLPDRERDQFNATGAVFVRGKRETYVINPYSQTEIRYRDRGGERVVGYACLQTCIPLPTYDRMIAEFLLLRNDEERYLKTANIFRRGREFGLATTFLIAFDIALLVNLVLEVLKCAG